MSIHYQDDRITLHQGDALEVARQLPDGAADCIVTSPPYFGLRSYLPDGVVLRDDITDDEAAYVWAELERSGLL